MNFDHKIRKVRIPKSVRFILQEVALQIVSIKVDLQLKKRNKRASKRERRKSRRTGILQIPGELPGGRARWYDEGMQAQRCTHHRATSKSNNADSRDLSTGES